MGVRRQNGEVEGLLARRQLRQVLFGEVEELDVLIAPPDIVVGGNLSGLNAVGIIPHLIAAVFLKIQLSSAEHAVGADQEGLPVAVARQNVTQVGHTGEKGLLRAHGAVGQRNLQRQAAGLGEQRPHGPGGSGDGIGAVDAAPLAGEADVLFGQRRQLRDGIRRESAAAAFVAEGGLHGFQPDINEVPLLFREGEPHRPGVNIVRFYVVGLGIDVLHVAAHAQKAVGVAQHAEEKRDPQHGARTHKMGEEAIPPQHIQHKGGA